MCKTCNWDPGEGKERVQWRFTHSHVHVDPVVMEKPLESCAIPPADPVPARPPSPAEICDDSDIPLLDAESACEHLRGHQQAFGECVMDYCGTGGDPDVVTVDEGALDDPEASCVGGECDPEFMCSNSPQATLTDVKHSNLVDWDMTAVILYSSTGIFSPLKARRLTWWCLMPAAHMQHQNPR